jgi:AcrR family transcriptional regulator
MDARADSRSTRRRGARLTTAIYLATLLELAETSFEGLTFDKIAARAEAGKASLYRRWKSPAELVLESLTDPSIGFSEARPPDTGSVRTDLSVVLRSFARALDQPHGRALRPLMTQRHLHPELFAEVHRLLVQPRLEVMLTILRRGAQRGEVAPEATTMRIAGVGLRQLIVEHMEYGTISESEVDAVISEILLPLIAPRQGEPR